MPIRYNRPYSHSAAWSRRIAVGALLLVVSAGAGHRTGLILTPTFVAIALAALFAAILALLLSIVGFARLWLDGAKGGRASFWGFALALTLIVPFALATWRYWSLPNLNDVTTDIAFPPEFLAVPERDDSWLARFEPPTAASRLEQRAAYPQVTTRRYDGAMDRVFSAVEVVAARRGITFTAAEGADIAPGAEQRDLPDTPETGPSDMPAQVGDPANVSGPVPVPTTRPSAEPVPVMQSSRVVVQGEARSPILGVKSDIVIRLLDEPETTRVDIRSATRHATHDLGMNAWQVTSFLDALTAELMGITPE